MSEVSRADKTAKFWERYINLLHKQGINPPFDRWHVVRAEQFIKAFPGKRLADHTSDSVAVYLRNKGVSIAVNLNTEKKQFDTDPKTP